jgi:hypothetical protein
MTDLFSIPYANLFTTFDTALRVKVAPDEVGRDTILLGQ